MKDLTDNQFANVLRHEAEELEKTTATILAVDRLAGIMAVSHNQRQASIFREAAARIDGAAVDKSLEKLGSPTKPVKAASSSNSTKLASEKQQNMIRARLSEVGLDEGFLINRWNCDNAELLTHDNVQEVVAALEVIKEQQQAS